MKKITLLCLLLLSSIATGAESDTRTERTQHHPRAEALVVEGFAGRLLIEPGSPEGIRLRIAGPEAAVEAVEAQLSRGRLTVRGPTTLPGQSVVYLGQGGVTVIAQGGGRASVVIGGRNPESISPASARQPLEITVRLPQGTPVTVEGLVGHARIGDTGGPVTLALAAGEAHLGRTGNAELTVNGSGTITATGVEGDLSVSIAGSGEVRVTGTRVDHLDVAIEGTGTVMIEAPARSAELTIAGSGDIAVKRVEARPVTRIQGSGEIRVDNWM